VKVGDLVRNKRHPHAGIGVIISVDTIEKGYGYAIAIFPNLCFLGEQIVYPDEAEVINESR
jgi:hypothetical protein